MLKLIHKKLHRISGFQIDKSKVEKIVNSQSFAIYSSGEIELLLTNPTHQRSFKLSTTEQRWTHFTLVIVKHNVFVLQNGKVVFSLLVIKSSFIGCHRTLRSFVFLRWPSDR
jgi:hypothetical protein